jgi:hypothetical protein
VPPITTTRVASGAERLTEPRTVTGGRKATIRHRDGLVVEYFEAAPATG